MSYGLDPQDGTNDYLDYRPRGKRYTEMTKLEQAAHLARIADLKLQEGLAEEAARERFGVDDDYPVGSVIVWTRDFGNRGRTYSYAAIKAFKSGDSARGWYITGKQVQDRLNFDELVRRQLDHAAAEGNPVFYVTAMEEI